MPKGRQGQKRPAGTISNQVMIAQIATGEIEDNEKSGHVYSDKAGVQACMQKLTSEQRSEITKKASNARYG